MPPKVQIQAQNNFILIRAERPPVSGITLLKTEQYNEKDSWLKTAPLIVYSTGPDVKNIKVGDRVILGAVRAARYDYLTRILGDRLPENVTYFACEEKDIVAVITQ
jgi:hypothetical protein